MRSIQLPSVQIGKVVGSVLWVNVLGLASVGLDPGAAHAQEFPSRVITIVVPTASGNGLDMFARLIGQRLAAGLGKPVIVDNRPGATGYIGAEAVARAPADGHTLLYATASLAVRQAVPPKPALDPQRDLAPVSMTLQHPWVLVAHPSLPVRNIRDLLALGRSRPGDLTFGGGGIGGTLHLAFELLKLETKLDARYIPYQGTAQAQVALLSGETQLAILGPPEVRPYVSNGKMRALAVTARHRSSMLPEIPTLNEAGVKQFEVLNWFGFFAPAKTPATTLARLHAEISKTLAASDMKERAATEGLEVVTGTASEFSAFFSAEIRKWSEVVKTSGVKFE